MGIFIWIQPIGIPGAADPYGGDNSAAEDSWHAGRATEKKAAAL